MKNLEGREFSPAFSAGFRLKSYRLCDISIIRVDTVWMVMETCCQLSRLGTLLTINPHSCARNKLNHSSLTMNHNVASTFFRYLAVQPRWGQFWSSLHWCLAIRPSLIAEAWPYWHAFRLGLIAKHQCNLNPAFRKCKKQLQNASNSYEKNSAKCVKFMCKNQCEMRQIHMQKTVRNAWNLCAKNSAKCVKFMCKKQWEMREISVQKRVRNAAYSYAKNRATCERNFAVFIA